MATLADIKADFETYQTDVKARLTALQATIATLTAQLPDPAVAQSIDDEIKAAIADLAPTPPAP